MITAQLMGGLGNNLFIVATAYALSRKTGDALLLSDDGWHALSGKHPMNYRDNIFKYFNWTDEKLNFPVYKEPKSYQPIPHKKGQDIKLYGYFQDSRYFDEYKDDILDLFFNHEIMHSILENDNVKSEMWSMFGDIISLHVRRGDYVRLSYIHPPISLDYIHNAIEYITSRKHVEKIWVFSDDLTWCKDNLNDKRMIFVDALYDEQNICIMSTADHHIISNSSYSWWGSYLDRYDGIRIAPKEWFGDGRREGTHTDVYTNNMIRL